MGIRVVNSEFRLLRTELVMRSNLLCRERLTRLLIVLDREGGSCSLRDLYRSYGIRNWEVEQAEEAGWVSIFEHKPTVGRPSWIAAKLSESHAAKLPPWKCQIPNELSIRHWRFAFELANIVEGRGYFGFSLSTAVRAYLIAFPAAKSRAGAAASASRLSKKPMIQAARCWFLATDLHSYDEEMPPTPAAIYERLAELLKQQEAKQSW
jgi:hypothetical protein